MIQRKYGPGKKAFAILKTIYNNHIMANLIKDYPNLIKSGDKLVELVHLKQVKGTIPPVKPESPSDPYVKRSELREELSKLEQRVDVKLNNLEQRMETKFDLVNARIDKLDTRIDKLDTRIDKIESILYLILNKLNIDNKQ